MSGFYASLAAAQADGLVHYWTMNGADGDSVVIDQGSGFNGELVSTFTGTPADSIVASPLGEARRVRFDNLTENHSLFVCDPVAAALPSVQYWNATFRMRILFDSYAALDSNGCYSVHLGDRLNNTGSLAIYLRNLSGSNPTAKWSRPSNAIEVAIDPNDWIELVAVSEGDANGCSLKLYANGTLLGSSSVGAGLGGMNPTQSNLSLGGDKTADPTTMRGLVDDVGFWSRALSASEISDLYNSGSARSVITQIIPVSKDLSVYWSIQENINRQLALSWDRLPEFSQVPIVADTKALSIYKCILTGSADSLSDLEIPISSFNARLRSSLQDYLSIVVPNGSDLKSEIESRSNGEIILSQVLNGEPDELIRVDLQDIRIDKGARSGTTLTLSGYVQAVQGQLKPWILSTYSYFSKSGGKHKVRLQALTSIKPRDHVTIGGASFVVDTVTFIGSINRIYMELSE